MRKILFWFTFILLTGCYQKVDLNVPFEGSKMVLEGFLSPDKGLDLQIRKTFDPYAHTDFDEDRYLVTNARVSIYQEGILIDSCRQTGNGRYLSLHPEMYRAGKVYEVQITTPGIQQVYVPDIRIPKESLVSPDEFNFKMQEERYYLLLSTTILNPDHYAIFIGRSWHDSRAKNPLDTWIAMDEHIIDECEGDLLYVSNKCEAGSGFEVVFLSELKQSTIPGGDDVFLPKSYIHYEVGQVDPRYKDFINKSNASDEPFIEPTLDPGNVEGGYGFIVGWNTESFTYEL